MTRSSLHRSLHLVALLLALARPARAEVDEVSALLEQLGSGREGAQVHAASRLFHLGQADRAVPQLSARLGRGDPDGRALAARLLGMLQSPRGQAPLISALADEDWAVRRDAAEALGQLGRPGARAALTGRLGDEHPSVRIAAARALGELGGAPSALAGALSREPEAEVRLHLIEALAQGVAPPGREGLAALRRALSDESESVRWLAASFLVEQGDGAALGLIIDRLRRGLSPTARQEAAEALGRASGGALQGAREALAEALTDESDQVGLAAAAALAGLGDPRGAEHLRRVARGDGPAALRAQALSILEAIGQ